MENSSKIDKSLTIADHHLNQAAKYRERVEFYQRLANEHHDKALHHLHVFRAAMTGDPLPVLDTAPTRVIPNAVYLWRDWLRNFGPHLRSEVEDAVKVKFNERATPFTLRWSDGMVDLSDDAYPQDQIVKMFVNRDKPGRGGLPTAYFLWSQRHDALAKFPNRPKQ